MAKYKKGSFTIIPNKNILYGQKAALQSIYFWLCEHANENGTCYPGRTRLAFESGTNIKTVDKYLKEMVLLGILTVTNRFKKKTKDTNLYQLMIVEDKEKEGVIPNLGLPYTKNGPTPSAENGPLTQPILTQPNNTETSSVFNWEKSKEHMMSKEGSDMDIIATFLDEKKLVPATSAELTGYIKRYRKVAKDIAPFLGKDFDRFWKAVEMCKEESKRLNYEWNLETIYKKITKI